MRRRIRHYLLFLVVVFAVICMIRIDAHIDTEKMNYKTSFKSKELETKPTLNGAKKPETAHPRELIYISRSMRAYQNNLTTETKKPEIKQEIKIVNKRITWPPKIEEFTEMPCAHLLDLLTTEYVLTLIIDMDFADKVNKKMNCTSEDYPPRMAVPTNVIPQSDENIVKYENDPQKNYFLIHDGEHRRAIFKYDYTTNYIWREYRNALIPRNVTAFQELWSRSQFLDCLKDYKEKPSGWNIKKVVKAMAGFVKYFMKFGMYPSLGCGTLLGWYRECGFIPYTKDIDFFYRAEEYNPDAFAMIYETGSPFRILYEWGKHNLNKEYSFSSSPKIDLFEVVSFNGSSHISVIADKVSYWNIYPAMYTSNCVADLYGYMFWIPCEPAVFLKSEYGDGWAVRDPKITYRKTKNLVKIRNYTKEEYNEFGLKKPQY